VKEETMTVQVQRIVRAIVLALAAAAIVAAGAQATRPDDRVRQLGVPDAIERAVNTKLAAVPDAVERAVNIKLALAPVRPDDRAGVRDPAPVQGEAQAPASAASSPGFQWADAAVGAGATIGVFMLGGVLLLTIRRRTHVVLP
jgi:hypothetical protein